MSSIKVGDTFLTVKSGIATVVAFRSSRDIEVRFENTGNVRRITNPHNLRAGLINDPMAPLACGVGFMGEGFHTSASDPIAHRKWSSMLQRVYAPDKEQVARDYANCIVTEAWCNFQNFAGWFSTQPFSGRKRYELDKDLRAPGNRTYCPDKCSLIPKELNSYISADRRSNLHGTGVGFVQRSGRYAASISYRGEKQYLGTYDAPEEAASAYRRARPALIRRLAVDLLSEGMITLEQADLVIRNYGSDE